MDLTAAQVEAREVGVERETGAQLACAVVADARIRMGEVRRLRRHGRLDDGHESRASKLREEGGNVGTKRKFPKNGGKTPSFSSIAVVSKYYFATLLTSIDPKKISQLRQNNSRPPFSKIPPHGTFATPYKSACTARRPRRRRR